MFREIGSEFWLDKTPSGFLNDFPEWLTRFGEVTFASSGRGAISLLLQQVSPKYKTVLLPAYICDSVIYPFVEHGFSCYFYEIKEDLSPNIDSIKSFQNIGIFLHMGYYGFPTNSNLLNVVKNFREQSTIIIEDITHSLFSTFNRFHDNDFYVGSIRKWFGLPSGGFIASSKNIIKRPYLINDTFSKIRTEALLNKGKYLKTYDDRLKELFLNQFSKAEELLDRDPTPYRIDNVSMELVNMLETDEVVKKRKENFKKLSIGLQGDNYFEKLFVDLPESVCPMFYPVMINENRDTVRKKLIEKKIYCPIHWSIPEQINDISFMETFGIYNTILSIPCDQRYGINEMERIISVFKCL